MGGIDEPDTLDLECLLLLDKRDDLANEPRTETEGACECRDGLELVFSEAIG